MNPYLRSKDNQLSDMLNQHAEINLLRVVEQTHSQIKNLQKPTRLVEDHFCLSQDFPAYGQLPHPHPQLLFPFKVRTMARPVNTSANATTITTITICTIFQSINVAIWKNNAETTQANPIV
jgi:hypothetical protein